MINKENIAVDAMGGENSPKKIIDGIELSLKENNCECEANLYESNLQGANFEKSNFTSANLTRVNFIGATLIEANFQNSNLMEADFTSANILNASFEGANLNNATWADGTKCAQGSIGTCKK